LRKEPVVITDAEGNDTIACLLYTSRCV